MKADDLDTALAEALKLFWDRRAKIDRIPEVRVELSFDPNEVKALRSRAPNFVQASDTGNGCHHEELLLIADEVDLTSRLEPVITCARCFKRWQRS